MLIAVQFSERTKYDKELKFGLNVTQASFLRHEFMADINYYARALDCIARNITPADDTDILTKEYFQVMIKEVVSIFVK